MDMHTPFRRVTGLGSAREGTMHFWYQRLTALANVPLTLFLVWMVISLIGADHATIIARFSNPFVSGLMLLTIVSVAWHMRLGIQIVIEDYIHGHAAKTVSLIANSFFAVGIAILLIACTFKLSFGG